MKRSIKFNSKMKNNSEIKIKPSIELNNKIKNKFEIKIKTDYRIQ